MIVEEINDSKLNEEEDGSSNKAAKNVPAIPENTYKPHIVSFWLYFFLVYRDVID